MSVSKQYIIAGLGNPREEYELTRHNAGRIFLRWFAEAKKKEGARVSDWTYDKKTNSLKAELKDGKTAALLFAPETYMNKSGDALKKIITSKAKAKTLAVLHDDLDLPLGKFKISFNRGSAGHKGVESIIRALKTQKFVRARVGVSPVSLKGKIKKPEQKKLPDFITDKFKKEEIATLKRLSKKVFSALDLIIKEKLEQAMSEFNS